MWLGCARGIRTLSLPPHFRGHPWFRKPVGEHLISVKEVLVVKLVKRSPGSDGRTPHSPDAPGRLPSHPIR